MSGPPRAGRWGRAARSRHKAANPEFCPSASSEPGVRTADARAGCPATAVSEGGKQRAGSRGEA